MRKHFLILMLMALLPLAGWAEEPVYVSLFPANYEPYYGDNIPDDGAQALPEMIGLNGTLSGGVTIEKLAQCLIFERVGDKTSKTQGIYAYKLTKKADYKTTVAGMDNVEITVVGGNGTMYIKKKPITITADNKNKNYGAVDPTKFTATVTGGLVGEETLTYTVSREEGENAGTYPIKVTVTENAVSDNYDITLVDGTFTINKILVTPAKAAAALATSVDVDAIIYNRLAWEPELTVSYDGEVLTTESGAIEISYTDNTNAGTATATVNFINYKNSNNTDFTKAVQFTIKKKSLGTDGAAAEGITTAFTSSFPGWTYSNTVKSTGGSATKVYYKVGDVKEALDKNTDYVREAVGDFTNSTVTLEEEDKPYYLFTGKGNYEGTVKLPVEIAQKELTITADNTNKVFSHPDPAYTFTYSGFATGDYTVEAEKQIPNEGVMTTAPTVTRTESGETVGTYTIEASGAVAKNYKMKYVPGKLTINPDAIIVTPDAIAQVYGEDEKKLTYTVSPAGAESLVEVTLQRANPENKNVGNYVITGTVTAAPGYSATITPGVNYSITKADLKFTAENQTIEQGEAPEVTEGSADPAALYTVSGFKYDDEDNLDISGATVTVTSTVTAASEAGEYLGVDGLKITVTGLDLANYNVVPVNGNVYVVGNGGTITLTRVAKERISEANVTELVKAYDGTTGHTVKIKFDDATGYNTMKPNKWYAMVLPFETDVKEISNAFGYAIVDLLKTTNDNVHRTIFKLKMDNQKIPANTPFIIKVWNTLDLNAEPVQFTGKTIVKPAVGTALAPNGNLVSEDAVGNKFIGSYDGIDGLGNSQAGYSGHVTWFSLKQDDDLDEIAIKASDTAYLRQMSAFNFIVDTPATHEFIIEELGGETTVIRGINAEAETFTGDTWYNLNGMKMQNVPSTKGIYINNGKKFVVK